MPLAQPFAVLLGHATAPGPAPDGTPRGWALVSADRPEREVALMLLPHTLRGQEALICDKGYAGRHPWVPLRQGSVLA